MKSKIHIGSFFLSIIVGLVVVLMFSWISGRIYSTALFPILALLSGFIITGFIIAVMSKEITIIEPGLGSVIVAAVAYFVLPLLNLKGFQGLWNFDWLLLFMNAIVLTFLGSWLGEKIQNGVVDSRETTSPSIDWSWIVAGTVAGMTVSMIMINILEFLYLIFGQNQTSFYVPFFITLFFMGLFICWKSPGVTIKEAGLAGFLTMTVDFNLIRVAWNTENDMGVLFLIIGLVAGFTATMLGGYIGEKIQSSSEKKKLQVGIDIS